MVFMGGILDDLNLAAEEGRRTFAGDGVGKRLSKRLVRVMQLDGLGDCGVLIHAAGVEAAGAGKLRRILTADEPIGGVVFLGDQADDFLILANEEELDAEIAAGGGLVDGDVFFGGHVLGGARTSSHPECIPSNI